MIPISASIKDELRAYYRRTDAPIDEAEKARVVALVSQEAAAQGADPRESVPFWRFLVGQLRFVNPLAWVLQVALLVGMLVLVGSLGESDWSMLVVMIAAVLSVALAVPSVFKSFENNMSELEASCRHDSAQVLLCRFVLFGLADVLWISLATWLVPALVDGDPFRVFLYAATPYFAFCSICFYLSRKLRGQCVKACIGAAACMVVALWAARVMFPAWYAETSILVWCIALAVSLVLAVHEARRLIAHVTADSLTRSPSFS